MESCLGPHVPAGLHGNSGINLFFKIVGQKEVQLQVAHEVEENIGKYANSGS